jgi:hypothetical protein
MERMRGLLAYFERCGIEFDTAVNVLTGGNLGQTVSLRVAEAQRAGKLYGCVFCWFLNWAVQPNHCQLQFTTKPSPWTVYVRAGIAFAVGIGSIVGLVRLGLHLVERLI